MKNAFSTIVAIFLSPSISSAVTIIQVAPESPDLIVTTDPSVTSSSLSFNDGEGFTGANRYYYRTTGDFSFSESLEFSSTTNSIQLNTVTWDFIQFFSTPTDYISVELVINGVPLGSATTQGLNEGAFDTISWDVSGVAPGSDYEMTFNVSEVGGAVGFFELIDEGAGFNGLVVDGTTSPIPEPSSLLLVGLGSLGVLGRRRRP